MRFLLAAALLVLIAPEAVQAQRYLPVAVDGVGMNDQFGSRLGAGDLNGDGTNDVLVVSFAPSTERFPTDREVQIFLGGSGFPTTGLGAGDADLVLSDASTEDRFGADMATGDLNGDGYDDVVVGVPFNNDRVDESGAVYVYCGSAAPDATRDRVLYGRLTVDNNPDMPGIADEGFNLGQEVAVGDLNGDGFDDVIAGGFSSGTGNYEYHVYLGDDGFCAGPPINAEDADATIRTEPGDVSGSEGLAVGNINGDIYDDIVIADSHEWYTGLDQSGGGVMAFFGAATLPPDRAVTRSSFAGTSDADVIIAAFEADGEGGSRLEFARNVSVGDLDGDGFDDIAVGAYREGLRVDDPGESLTFIYRGGTSLPAFSIRNDADGELSFGSNLDVGDVSGEGQADLLVVRSNAAGETVLSLFYGPLAFPFAAGRDDADFEALSPSTSAPLPAPAALGNVNTTSCLEFGVGTPLYDATATDVGRAWIYSCNPFFLYPAPDIVLQPRCAYRFRSWRSGMRLCGVFYFEIAPGVLDDGERQAMSFGGIFIPDPQSNDPDDPDLIDVSEFYDIDRAPDDCPDPEAGCVRFVLNEAGVAEADRLQEVLVEVISESPEVPVDVSAVGFSGQIRLGSGLVVPASPPPVAVFGSYDLYAYLPASGATVQVSSIPARGEFNPSWAPFGPYLVHDVAAFGPGDAFLGQELAVTNAATGASVLLPGTDGGNDAAWWPYGLLIAYDRAAASGPDEPGPDETVYLSAAWGGPRLALRADAVDPSWSPTGRYLAFRQPSDGSVRARDLLTGAEVVVAEAGQNPAWSPTGRAIAFSDGDDLYRVPVRRNGTPTGPAVAVTSGPALDSQPAWYASGGRLAYQSDATGAIDLYAVPASGGGGSFLSGDPVFGDFDPAVYPTQAGIVAYAGYTDPAARLAAGTVEAPARSVAALVAEADPEVAALAGGLGAADPDRLDAWLASLGGQAVAAEAGAPDAFAVAAFPNPASAAATVRVSLPEAGHVEVVVLDALGREVARLAEGPREAGVHAVTWAADVPAGVYLVRVRAGDTEAVHRITVVR